MKPINDPRFWKGRIDNSSQLHHSVYCCSDDLWAKSENKHKALLQEVIKPDTSILDVGCAYGRLLSILPAYWKGSYLGFDLSPDFIEMAKKRNPGRSFMVCNIVGCEKHIEETYDVGIAISIKGMVVANMGSEAWRSMEESLCKVVNELLILEY